MTIYFRPFCIFAAVICFALKALGVGGKIDLFSAGFAFLSASLLP